VTNAIAEIPAPSSSASLVATSQLAREDADDMHALLDRHFEGVAREQFDRDLADKNWVLLLRDGTSGSLAGFSTMAVYETRVGDGSAVSVVCSGDTIVDPSAWGSAALPREWIAAVKRLRARYPNGPYYWLLITSGFRTYRLLSTFWQTFYPRFATPTPADQQRLLETLARDRFGDAYDTPSGIVRFARPQILRPHLAGVPESRTGDPHVAFFASRNPGHARGDELACLCEVSDDNLTRAGRRMVLGPGAEARGR
jgi:hypothetical protein